MAFATIGTTGIADDAVTSAKVAPGVVDTEAQPNQEPLAYNGNMEVAQRGTSTTGLTNGSSGYHTVDRWKWHENGSPSSVWTMTQETLTSGNAYADGFNNALKIDCTTAQGSLGAGDTLHIEQRFEKQDLGAFKKGTANAQKFTFGFWVKATKTGTNIIELQDQGNDRAVSATYTISTTNTWEHKVVTFPADTTGNFGTSNALGLIIRFYIFAGSNYTSSSLQTSWGASSTAARANGQVNNADSTSNNWHLTGVQLEVGEYTSSTLPPFQHESFGDNLARCQRYCQVYKTESAYGMMSPASVNSATAANGIFTFPTHLRAIPSLSTSGSFGLYSGDGGDAVSGIAIDANSDDASRVVCTISGSGFTDNSAAFLRAENDSDAKMTFDAEL